VATSSGFWHGRFGRWLGSTKNIAGCVLAGAVIVLQVLVGLGPFWPLVVVVAYAVGALVAPRERVSLVLGLGDDAGADQLQEQLKVLRRSLSGEASRLDDDAEAEVTKILDSLDDIVNRWGDLSGAPDQQHTVEQMIADYLPTSLQGYLNLPRTYALSARVAGRKTAHDELMDQLKILETESARIRDAVYSREVDALSDQSRFLRQKFARSSLDIGPGDGAAGEGIAPANADSDAAPAPAADAPAPKPGQLSPPDVPLPPPAKN
jgi:hypothetical protein